MSGQPSTNGAIFAALTPLFVFNSFYVYNCLVCMYVCALCIGACRGQKRTLDLLELKLTYSCETLRVGLLGPEPRSSVRQPVLLTTELFF